MECGTQPSQIYCVTINIIYGPYSTSPCFSNVFLVFSQDSKIEIIFFMRLMIKDGLAMLQSVKQCGKLNKLYALFGHHPP
jgi:hypothetical protein